MQNRNRTLWTVIIAAVLLLCVYCLCIALIGAFFFTRSASVQTDAPPVVVTRVVTVMVGPRRTATPAATASVRETSIVTATPAITGTLEPQTPEAVPSATPLPTGEALGTAEGALPPVDPEAASLYANEMPAADPRALAMRLKPNAGEIPLVVNDAPPVYKVGDVQEFWVSNNDTQEHEKIKAELKYMTDHVAVWVEEGVRFNQRDLEASADRFEKETYPTNREFFGSEWTPGVDNDPRLHILHARGLGENIAGYYSSGDEYSKQVHPYSNEREMFYISADSGNARPNSTFYDGTLAHEFQHMIHWANDRNEDSWVNEGLSELASFLNGFDPGGSDIAYSEQPDTQLTTWGDMTEGNAEHYGASYLFMSYFLDRFGEDLTKAVVASAKNGIAGFDEALAKAGRPERFDDVFADWVIANYLDLPDADAEGRFGYNDIDVYPMNITETYRSYPATGQAKVSQYGADYIRLRGNGPYTIDFEGQNQVQLMAAEPQGTYSWWSNRGDQSDSTLTRAFDLTNAAAPKLTFSAWYDIEEGWDYAYIEASADGGKTWDILRGQTSTDKNPVGNAFGPGWTGVSGGGDTPEWIEESVDLAAYAGKEILLRFEMVTDDAMNKPGLMIDNLAISEIGYQDDGESGPGDWQADGWLLTDNSVSERWLVQLISANSEGITVQRMPVEADGRGQLSVPALPANTEVALVVSALAPMTTEPGTYKYTISQP
jgi:immune inhibitor A